MKSISGFGFSKQPSQGGASSQPSSSSFSKIGMGSMAQLNKFKPSMSSMNTSMSSMSPMNFTKNIGAVGATLGAGVHAGLSVSGLAGSTGGRCISPSLSDQSLTILIPNR